MVLTYQHVLKEKCRDFAVYLFDSLLEREQYLGGTEGFVPCKNDAMEELLWPFTIEASLMEPCFMPYADRCRSYSR